MRIAVGAFMLGSSPTGLGIYTQNVLRELRGVMAEGDTATVYTAEQRCVPTPFEKQIRRLPRILTPGNGTLGAIARSWWTWAVFPGLLKQYDLHYSPTHHGVTNGRCPQVITVHDMLPIRFPSQYRLQHYYFTHLLPKIIQHSSAVIVDSESTRQDVHSYYGVALNKLHVVYAAVNHDEVSKGSETSEVIKRKYRLDQYVLIVGATYPHKNIEKAIEAFESVRREISPMQLVIAGGRHEYINVLKAKAANLDVQAIRFLGYVPSGDMAGLYAGAQVLLYPSLYEGFGLPPLEAMACGCPVIASQVSSMPEVCGPAASYVDPYQVDGIAEALLRVLKDEELRANLRRTGLQQVRRYSWGATARDIYRVLRMSASA